MLSILSCVSGLQDFTAQQLSVISRYISSNGSTLVLEGSCVSLLLQFIFPCNSSLAIDCGIAFLNNCSGTAEVGTCTHVLQLVLLLHLKLNSCPAKLLTTQEVKY